MNSKEIISNRIRRGGKFLLSDIEFLLSEHPVDLFNALKKKARDIKLRYFGKTVRLYRPIYVSNYCINDCEYCGCAVSVKQERKALTENEIKNECIAVKSDRIDSVLLVAGEDRRHCSVDYLCMAVRTMKKYFSFVAVEAGVFEKGECEALLRSGADSFVLYQETFDRDRYGLIHKGKKRDYDRRIEAVYTAAEAGFQSFGFGILLGIAEWRNDVFALAKFAANFRRKYWNCSVGFSFPRLRPPACDKFKDFFVSERELERIFVAFRLVFPDAELNISTRESALFRDNLIQHSATTMSAASGTYPGAYASSRTDKELEQFEIQDRRTVDQISIAVRKAGFEPVFKYWDRVFSSCSSVEGI